MRRKKIEVNALFKVKNKYDNCIYNVYGSQTDFNYTWLMIYNWRINMWQWVLADEYVPIEKVDDTL